MASIQGQRERVTESVLHESGHDHRTPRRWPRHTYTVAAGLLAPPEPGECITTIPGAYWRVLAVAPEGGGYVLTLEELRPTSLEAHSARRHLAGGTLS